MFEKNCLEVCVFIVQCWDDILSNSFFFKVVKVVHGGKIQIVKKNSNSKKKKISSLFASHLDSSEDTH